MKKITFGMLIITFVMFLGLLVTSDVSFAKIDSNLDEERNVYLNIMTCNKMQYHMVKDIVNDKHHKHTQRPTEGSTLTAAEGRTADHAGRDCLEFPARTGCRLRTVDIDRCHNTSHTREQAADQERDEPDQIYVHALKFRHLGVAAAGIETATEYGLLLHKAYDHKDRQHDPEEPGNA